MRIKYCPSFYGEVLEQPCTVALSMGVGGYAYSHDLKDIKLLFKLSKFISPNVRNEKTFVYKNKERVWLYYDVKV